MVKSDMTYITWKSFDYALLVYHKILYMQKLISSYKKMISDINIKSNSVPYIFLGTKKLLDK